MTFKVLAAVRGRDEEESVADGRCSHTLPSVEADTACAGSHLLPEEGSALLHNSFQLPVCFEVQDRIWAFFPEAA